MALDAIRNRAAPNIRGGSGHLLAVCGRNPLATAGGAVVLGMAVLALFSPILAPYDYQQIDIANRLAAPTADHLMGTDELGRDIFSRVVFGARISLPLGIAVVACIASLGLVIGGLSGLVGGFTDAVLMRCADVVLSIPGLILAMSLAAALGPSLQNVVIALALVRLPHYVRLARGQALVVRSAGYVDAAKLAGGGTLYRLRHHILPNIATPVLIQATSDIGGVILAASSLSFLGLGAQPPTPEWGAMVSTGRQYFLTHWWYATFPGLAILITAMGFNLLGDGLRDAFDPRARN